MTIFTFFFWLFWLQMLNLPAALQNKNTRIGPFPWKRSVLQNPDRERTNQSTGICLGLALPYNNSELIHCSCIEVHCLEIVVLVINSDAVVSPCFIAFRIPEERCRSICFNTIW